MQTKKIRLILLPLFVLCTLVLSPYMAQAVQPEPAVECDEGIVPEPIDIVYGEHVSNCLINTTTDMDQFTFSGSSGDYIRINVSSVTSNWWDPKLEVLDPDGAVIDSTYCEGGPTCAFAVNLLLDQSGTYRLAISDAGLNDTGSYVLQLEKIPPPVDPPSIPYNSTVSDGVNLVTDVDFLVFGGEAGTDIRLNLSSVTSNWWDPRLEIWGPDGSVIENTYCNGGPTCAFAVDLSLVQSGTYLIAISDAGLNDTGSYQIDLQCLFGPCPDLPAQPDITGCIREEGQMPVDKRVTLKQRGEPTQITKTDANGCYKFDSIVPNKVYTITYKDTMDQ